MQRIFFLFLFFLFPCILFAGDIEITISGADAPIDGSVYTVTGGEAPYTWDIACGLISADGVVSGASNCCGKGIVTVTDDCGYEAEKVVRMPKGNWSVLSGTTYGGCPTQTGCILIEGIYKTAFRWFFDANFYYCSGQPTCGGCPAITELWYEVNQAYWVPCSAKTYQYGYPYKYFLYQKTMYEWVCQ